MEVYGSTDVEADGPIPGPHSMLSFGSAAYLADKTLLRIIHANLDKLPGATGHPDTMAWWRMHREAYDATRKNTRPPEGGVPKSGEWLKDLPGEPVSCQGFCQSIITKSP